MRRENGYRDSFKKSSQEGQAGSGAIPERKAAVMRIKRKHFRTLSGAIAFVMFFLIIGTVGAMECDTVPLTEGMIRAFVFMALWVLFTYLAGGFEEYTERRSSHEIQAEDAFTGPGRPGRQGPHSSGRRTYHH